MYANYAFVAMLFSVAGFVLGRGTYPSVSKRLKIHAAKKSFLAFKAVKVAEGLQTFTCKGCGKEQRSVGIPTGWMSRPSLNTFNCSRPCSEDAAGLPTSQRHPANCRVCVHREINGDSV